VGIPKGPLILWSAHLAGRNAAAWPDPLRFDPDRFVIGYGLDADERGRLIDGSGVASASLFAVGPMRKGALWETTAVPEIRVQAAQVAEYIASGLTSRESRGVFSLAV
jgi:uncharacterized NAD(P)/FAD-binding protein YdhS